MQPSLTELDTRLDPALFFRVSRSAIVNLDAVREVTPVPGGHGEAKLSNGLRLEVSRRRLKTLMDRLGVSPVYASSPAAARAPDSADTTAGCDS